MEETHGGISQKLTAKEIYAFRNFAPALSPKGKTLVESIFGEDIKLISTHKNYSSLLVRLYGHALDPGLKRKVTFEKKEREDVAMLNRSSFLYELRRRSGFMQTNDDDIDFIVDRNFKMLSFDLKNLRAADQVIDNENNSMADFILNLTAGALNNSIQTAIRELGIKPEDIIVGRYGGDEFYVALIGEQEMAKAEEVKKRIKSYVEKEKGLFKISGRIEERNLELKDGKVVEIDIPKDDVKRKLFLSFLQRGLVLNEAELNKDKELFVNDDGEIDHVRFASYLKTVSARHIYPQEIEQGGYKAQIEYLVGLHPELAVPFYLAIHLDQVDSSKGEAVVTRQVALLDFVENYLVDPLLDEIIVSRFDLVDHLKRGEFSKLYGFEVKVKEVNDHLSYATGDEAIISLWKHKQMIRQILGTEMSKVKIGRFAGTIFFGLKKGEVLSAETEEEIRKLTNIGIPGNFKGIDYILPLGISQVDVDELNTDTPDSAIKTKISQMFDLATENWNENTFNRLIKDQNSFAKFINMLEDMKKDFDEDFFALLSARYFTGARWEERIARARKALEKMKGREAESEKKKNIEIIEGVLEDFASRKETS